MKPINKNKAHQTIKKLKTLFHLNHWSIYCHIVKEKEGEKIHRMGSMDYCAQASEIAQIELIEFLNEYDIPDPSHPTSTIIHEMLELLFIDCGLTPLIANKHQFAKEKVIERLTKAFLTLNEKNLVYGSKYI